MLAALIMAASAVFPAEDLTRFRTDLVDGYPPTSCVAQAIMGSEYKAMLERDHKAGASGEVAEWEKAKPEAGSAVFVSRHYQDPGGYIIWAHESGAVVVGERKGDALFLYTNEGARAKEPPAAIRGWMNEVPAAKPTWKVELAPACSQVPTTKFRSERDGTTCGKENLDGLTFTQRPYLVREKAPVLSAPTATAQEKGPYLVAGDMVQVATTDFAVKPIGDKVCAYYRSAKGRETLGWIAKDLLIEIPEEESPTVQATMRSLPESKWFATSNYRSNFPGRYKRDNSIVRDTLRIEAKKGAPTIKIRLKGDPDIFDVESFVTGTLLGPRLATYDERGFKAPPGQVATLYLFNNGVFVHLENLVMHTHYWAIYYP